MKKLYLVDVSSMFFRAFYAIRQLSNSKGMPTNAVYGFLSMIVKLQKDAGSDYVVFCFDRPEPSFRKDVYGEYKANRSEMPDELVPQIPYIKNLTAALGIPMFEQAGYEADDLIGSLTHFGLKHKMEVVIVSGDKDFSQLINDRVSMLDTMKNSKIGPAEVLEKWGVRPDQFIDYQALTGDSSDNIPGVRGVGPKGAQKLIEQFGNLENIYKDLDSVKNPGLRQKLAEAKDMAFLSKKLVTIVTDMKLNIDPEDLSAQPVNRADLEKLLDELEFQTFKKNLLGASSAPSTNDEASTEKKPSVTAPKEGTEPPSQTKSIYVPQGSAKMFEMTEKDLASWLKNKKSIWLVDFERQYIFADGEEVVVYGGADATLLELLNQKTLSWKGFNLKAAWRQLGLTTKQDAEWDSYLAAYVVRAGAIESFKETFQVYVKPLPELPDPLALYQAQLELEKVLLEKLRETQMEQILRTIELPLVDILTAMETKGVLIDSEFLHEESKVLATDIKKVEKEIHAEAGEEFNVASPKQLGNILFEKMKLPVGKKTKTGYSTNTDVLEKLEDHYPIASKVIQYREYSKLKSTYVDALPLLVNEKTGRVHSSFNQALTATGRLSSTNPNLQNIPIRTERGMRIRRAFIAAPGHVLVSADYSQIELRILAHIAKDKGLKEAFSQDIDIHTKTASEVFEVGLDEVTDDLRRKAKAVNFGIAYGQGPHGLAEGLKISRAEAKEIIEKYFQRFSGVKNYMQSAVEFVREKGYVETILGRRRYLPEINSKNHAIRAFAERAAINAPIQGMSSDLVKMAMIEVAPHFRDSLILQVHDELIFELPDDKKLPEQMERIKQGMETCMTLDVPLKVNIDSGKNWSEI